MLEQQPHLKNQEPETMNNEVHLAQNEHEQKGAMLFLRARTSLHPGAGTAVGAVDLPVQREKHTGWPLIQSSSIKGVLRDAYRLHLIEQGTADSRADADKDKGLEALFGPAKSEDNDQHAGAMGFTDARVLAFPLRSAKGVFAWVTCPAVIARLKEDITLTRATDTLYTAGIDAEAEIIVANRHFLTVEGRGVVLEDMLFTTILEEQQATATTLARWLSSNIPTITGLQPENRLAIIPDNAFTHAVKHCTEIITRIALDYDAKKVKSGALFNQEVLPSETLMYSVCLMNKPRGKGLNSAAQALDAMTNTFAHRTLQLGGDETTGKGWCDAFLKTASEMNNAKGGA